MAIARQLGAAIVAGELADGEALPSEKELALQLEVGRSTVREALRILQARGLVSGGDQVSTRGPTVDRSGVMPNATFALTNVLRLGEVDLQDLVSLRLVLEEAVMRAAAQAPVPQALARARAALERMRAAGDDIERFHQDDVAFHAALAEASGNRAFSLMMNVLRDTMQRHLHEALQLEAEPRVVLADLVKEHEGILDALEAKDGERAAARVRAHVSAFYARRAEP